MNQNHDRSLPVKHNLTLIYASSLIIALLMAGVSVYSLLYQDQIYPTEQLLRTFMPNDVVNLFIGVPILLGSMWAARRGKLIGLLFWTGALFFGIYNTIAYVFALPFNWAFLLNLVIAVLSVYTLIGLAVNIDGKIVQQQISGRVPEKLCGGVLVALGLLFFLRVIGLITNALRTGVLINPSELAVNISDIFIAPAFIIVGIQLWRAKALGYTAGLGLLFQGSMLFIGLLIFLLIQPLLTSAPFAAVDFIVIAVMGLVCFLPFAYFLRGVIRSNN
ncbi:MAG: hypothetical protein ABFS03_07530 [Chloroflexota bacterium]